MFIPGFLISLLTFPGVIVHELAHVAFCKLTDTPVLKVCLFRVGNPAGYVIHEQPPTVWRHILIGVGPFFINTLVGFALGIVAIPMHMDLDHLTALQLLLLWLGVSVAMHSFPSTGDAKSIWHAVWSKNAPISARVVGSPLVAVIFAGAIGSIFWLDALYGVGVVGAADALQKASKRHYAARPSRQSPVTTTAWTVDSNGLFTERDLPRAATPVARQAAHEAEEEIWHCTFTEDPMGYKGAVFVFDRENAVARPIRAGLPDKYLLGLPQERSGGTSDQRPFAVGHLECEPRGVCWVTILEGPHRWQFFIPAPEARDKDGKPLRAWIQFGNMAFPATEPEYGFCTQHKRLTDVQQR